MKRLKNSFCNAFRGIINTFRTEKNFRIHTLFATGVIAAGFFFGIKAYEWLAVMVFIGLVMASECMNTAIEKTVDMICSEKSDKAGFIKDAAAGGVLIASVAAAAAGVMVFGKYVYALFR